MEEEGHRVRARPEPSERKVAKAPKRTALFVQVVEILLDMESSFQRETFACRSRMAERTGASENMIGVVFGALMAEGVLSPYTEVTSRERQWIRRRSRGKIRQRSREVTKVEWGHRIIDGPALWALKAEMEPVHAWTCECGRRNSLTHSYCRKCQKSQPRQPEKGRRPMSRVTCPKCGHAAGYRIGAACSRARTDHNQADCRHNIVAFVMEEKEER